MNYENTRIDKIEFKILTNNEILKYSVINEGGIDIAESYDNNEPKRGGLIDSRLGSTNHNVICATCNLNNINCPGHFGHVELTEKVFNYAYFKHVKSILECICIQCSNLLLNVDYNNKNTIETLLNKRDKIRFTEIKKMIKNIDYCKVCNTQVPKIKKEPRFGVLQYYAESQLEDKVVKDILTAERCYAIFQNITDDSYRLLGFNPDKSRPEDLIIKYFPFPPISIRPSTKAEYLGGEIQDNRLTSRLAYIIKANKNLRKAYNKDQPNNLSKIMNNNSKYESLQYHIATYCDNDSLVLPKSEDKNGNQVVSIASRLKGKEGRIRGNLMGKRVDYSARTVITSDPFIGLNEVGVPIKIAMILTFPEQVTSHNIERLTRIIQNGKDKYPGANFVYSINGDKKHQIDLKYGKNITLKYGDIVERHLIDGDKVLLNRQPTLHKMSMMCHTIKVIDDNRYNTFRINSSVCKPFNAD